MPKIRRFQGCKAGEKGMTDKPDDIVTKLRAANKREIASWGPTCKRCGAGEFRVHGFCSVYCKDMYEVEQEVERLRAALEKLKELTCLPEINFESVAYAKTYMSIKLEVLADLIDEALKGGENG